MKHDKRPSISSQSPPGFQAAAGRFCDVGASGRDPQPQDDGIGFVTIFDRVGGYVFLWSHFPVHMD